MAKKKKLNVALLIAILALAINIITASIYIYQASIMREEQHAAVWPHIEWGMSYIQDEGFSIRVKNNGVGPALISEANMKFNGQEVPGLDSLLRLAIDTATRKIPHLSGVVENRVLSAGESIKLIKVEAGFWAELLYYNLTSKNEFEYSIYYESIYGQKWVSKGFEVEAIDGE